MLVHVTWKKESIFPKSKKICFNSAGSIVGVSELRAMLSHLDINWCLTISNSIEINRLVCVTEVTPRKSRDNRACMRACVWSLFSVVPSESIFIARCWQVYILQIYKLQNWNRKLLTA